MVNKSVRRAVAEVFGEDVADEIITLTEKQVEVAGGRENGAKLMGMQLLILDNLFSQHGRGTIKLDKKAGDLNDTQDMRPGGANNLFAHHACAESTNKVSE